MIPFEFSEPTSLREAIAQLGEGDASVRPFAGGTALMLLMKAGVFQPSRLVSLGKIEDLYSRISFDSDGTLHIGAMTTLSTLEYSQELRVAFPIFAQTLRHLSNIRVRNVARVGGALAHGDPHMDLPPLLAALGARAVAIGPAGQREIAIDELYAGYYRTVLEQSELIAEVVVPKQESRRAAYLKYTTGSAHDWPALGIAVSIDCDGVEIRKASVVVSAATEKVTRLSAAQKVLVGATVNDAILRKAGDAAVDEATLVADARGSISYKQQLLRVCVGRAVRMALSNGGGT